MITYRKPIMQNPINKKLSLSKTSILLFLTIVIAFTLFAKISVLNPTSPDSWTHMGIGKYIVENKKIPLHADISFKQDVAPSLEWISHSWLADIFFYISGSVNIMLTGPLLLLPNLLLSLYLLFKVLKEMELDSKNIFILLPIPIVLANIFWKVHPLPFSIPLLLFTFLAYLKWKNGNWKYIFLIPIIIMIFANTAGAIVFIPILLFLLIFITESIIGLLDRNLNLKKYPRGIIKFLAASFALSITVTLLNPYMIRIWFYPFTFFGILEKKNWLSSLAGALMLVNQNFLRTPNSSFLLAIYLSYMLLIVFGLLYIIVRKRGIFWKYYYLAPLLLFLLLPIVWIRFIPMTVFLTLPLFAIISVQLFNMKNKLVGKYMQYLIIFIISTSSLYLLINSPKKLYEIPRKQIELIQKFNLPINTLTTPEITGYAFYSLLPNKVGIDAQDDLFDENELITTFNSNIPANPAIIERITDENSIGTVLVSKNHGDLGYIFNQIKDWELIYFDDNGYLFSKRSLLDESFTEENEIKYLDLGRDLGFDPKQATEAAKELEKFISRYPESNLAIGQLASIYRIQGRFEKAEETLMKIPEKKWNYIVMTEMARLQAAQGYCKSSEQWFLKALKDRKEQNFSRAVLDLAVLYAGCLNEPEKAKHFLDRYNSFQLSPVEREKSRQIAEDFGIKTE